VWQYRKVYARWCMPSPRAPTTAPDAPPLHLYSTSDPADSVPTSPMTPPNPHFRIQPSFYLPPPNPPLSYLSPPNLPSPYLPPPSPAITVYTTLTVAAFEASAADASSATNSASPPRPHPIRRRHRPLR